MNILLSLTASASPTMYGACEVIQQEILCSGLFAAWKKPTQFLLFYFSKYEVFRNFKLSLL